MKWYMFFYEQASPKYKVFETKEALEVEAGKFLFYHKNETDDNYIDLIVGTAEEPYISPFFTPVV